MTDWESMRKAYEELKEIATKHEVTIITAQQPPPLPGHRRPYVPEGEMIILDYVDVMPRR